MWRSVECFLVKKTRILRVKRADIANCAFHLIWSKRQIMSGSARVGHAAKFSSMNNAVVAHSL